MSTIEIRCPTTGQVIDLGIDVDPATYLRMPLDTPLKCPACGREHSWENAIPPSDAVEMPTAEQRPT